MRFLSALLLFSLVSLISSDSSLVAATHSSHSQNSPREVHVSVNVDRLSPAKHSHSHSIPMPQVLKHLSSKHHDRASESEADLNEAEAEEPTEGELDMAFGTNMYDNMSKRIYTPAPSRGSIPSNAISRVSPRDYIPATGVTFNRIVARHVREVQAKQAKIAREEAENIRMVQNRAWGEEQKAIAAVKAQQEAQRKQEEQAAQARALREAAENAGGNKDGGQGQGPPAAGDQGPPAAPAAPQQAAPQAEAPAAPEGGDGGGGILGGIGKALGTVNNVVDTVGKVKDTIGNVMGAAKGIGGMFKGLGGLFG